MRRPREPSWAASPATSAGGAPSPSPRRIGAGPEAGWRNRADHWTRGAVIRAARTRSPAWNRSRTTRSRYQPPGGWPPRAHLTGATAARARVTGACIPGAPPSSKARPPGPARPDHHRRLERRQPGRLDRLHGYRCDPCGGLQRHSRCNRHRLGLRGHHGDDRQHACEVDRERCGPLEPGQLLQPWQLSRGSG